MFFAPSEQKNCSNYNLVSPSNHNLVSYVNGNTHNITCQQFVMIFVIICHYFLKKNFAFLRILAVYPKNELEKSKHCQF